MISQFIDTYMLLQSRTHLKLKSLRWRDSVSNHQPHDCLLNLLFRRRSKKTSKLRVTGPCAGNSPETGEFPAQMACNAENVSIWWRHHVSPNLARSKHPCQLSNRFENLHISLQWYCRALCTNSKRFDNWAISYAFWLLYYIHTEHTYKVLTLCSNEINVKKSGSKGVKRHAFHRGV